MEVKEFELVINELKENLENKTTEEIKSQMAGLEEKYNEAVANASNELKEELEAKMNLIQDHADKLEAKMKEPKKVEQRKGDELKSLITENFEQISQVRKGKAVEVKAVGNMVLGTHLTGDQPRDYSMDVVMTPGQMVNVADLISSITISGGTYTFPRETGGEGSIGAQTEGSDKLQKDYDLSMIDVNTDFIAGFCVYSKKMKNNLPFLESFLPQALRRDYWIAENSAFNTTLAAAATASTEVITGQNKVEMLIAEIAKLEGSNYAPNAIVVKPADFYDILVTEKSTGAGYGLPGVVTFSGGQLAINGIPVVKANWLAANKYYVGDWSRIKKVTTEGLGLEFSESDEDNFRKNNITARIEAQVALAVEQPAAIVYGDFTAV
jgi:HK97 family phage major capsid protein